MEAKTVQDSSLLLTSVMQLSQANPAGNVHGGEVIKMMDTAAGVVAYRHAKTNIVTAKVDELRFNRPVYVGNLVTCHAYLTFVGRSSMEIAVTVHLEEGLPVMPNIPAHNNLPDKCVLTGYFTLVALDPSGRPTPVPPLKLTTDEEHERFKAGQLRYEASKKKATC